LKRPESDQIRQKTAKEENPNDRFQNCFGITRFDDKPEKKNVKEREEAISEENSRGDKSERRVHDGKESDVG